MAATQGGGVGRSRASRGLLEPGPLDGASVRGTSNKVLRESSSRNIARDNRPSEPISQGVPWMASMSLDVINRNLTRCLHLSPVGTSEPPNAI
eukprot:8407342-Pyramimonas_sp.AAC.1